MRTARLRNDVKRNVPEFLAYGNIVRRRPCRNFNFALHMRGRVV